MKISKKIETRILENEAFASGNHVLEAIAQNIALEFEVQEDTSKRLPEDNRSNLYRVWHSTRAFDSGLRMFLEKHGRVPADTHQHSLGGYLHALQNLNGYTGFKQLDGTTASAIQSEIVEGRNVYAHAAGTFPTKEEADYMISKILTYYNQIYSL